MSHLLYLHIFGDFPVPVSILQILPLKSNIEGMAPSKPSKQEGIESILSLLTLQCTISPCSSKSTWGYTAFSYPCKGIRSERRMVRRLESGFVAPALSREHASFLTHTDWFCSSSFSFFLKAFLLDDLQLSVFCSLSSWRCRQVLNHCLTNAATVVIFESCSKERWQKLVQIGKTSVCTLKKMQMTVSSSAGVSSSLEGLQAVRTESLCCMKVLYLSVVSFVKTEAARE